MSVPNPIIVPMEVAVNDLTVPMELATRYDLPIELETLEADHNGTFTAPAGVAWNMAEVDVSAPSGTVGINSNGIHDVADYALANVNVPNSYSASDEGKVVDNGSLVGQTSRTVTANGTFDTTTNNSVTVDISGIRFELIGSVTMALEEYTDSSVEQIIDTGINISLTDFAYGAIVITCDSAITTSTEWGMTFTIFGRYIINNNLLYSMSMQQKGSATLSRSMMLANTLGINAYGVYIPNNTDSVYIYRKCHPTGCPKIRAGNYTVKVYGMTRL